MGDWVSAKDWGAGEEVSCAQVTLWCPDTTHNFTTLSCCTSEEDGGLCSLARPQDIAELCPLYTCYHYTPITANFGVQNGCNAVPNYWLNKEACIIHDLCHATPSVSQTDCDNQLRENINTIYHNISESLQFPEVAIGVGFHQLGIGDIYFQEAQFLAKSMYCRLERL